MAEITNDSENLLELVPITLFYGEGKYSEPLYVGINGKNWLIPRGKEVMIPRYVRNHIYASQKSEVAAKIERDRLSRQFEQDSKRF